MDETNLVRKRIHVTGRVQGVFFRASTKKVAEDLNLAGFARNNHDGSVTIEVEGPEREVNRLADWTREGPRLAMVDETDVKVIPTRSEPGFFTE